MLKKIKTPIKELFYYKDNQKIIITQDNKPNFIYGNVSNIKGDVSCIRGNVSCIRGDVSNIRGYVSYIEGNVSNISGNVSNISGNVSNISGDVSYISGDVSQAIEEYAIKHNITSIDGFIDVELLCE